MIAYTRISLKFPHQIYFYPFEILDGNSLPSDWEAFYCEKSREWPFHSDSQWRHPSVHPFCLSICSCCKRCIWKSVFLFFKTISPFLCCLRYQSPKLPKTTAFSCRQKAGKKESHEMKSVWCGFTDRRSELLERIRRKWATTFVEWGVKSESEQSCVYFILTLSFFILLTNRLTSRQGLWTWDG